MSVYQGEGVISSRVWAEVPISLEVHSEYSLWEADHHSNLCGTRS